MNNNICIAKRENNNKRNFIIVNKKQGKHFPTSPTKALNIFDELYSKIENQFNNEIILVIGFSETATAIGTRIAQKLNCKYIQTTREKKIDNKYIYFSEEHSHASEQKLAFYDINNIYPKLNRIIFVEDEITTGKTILNIIDIIKKSFNNNDNIKFTAISILNSMTNENLIKFKENNIDIKYIYKIDNKNYNEYLNKLCYNGKYIEKSNYDINYTELYFNFKLSPSHNIIEPFRYQKYCDELYNYIYKNIDLSNINTILILGTEEFMYFPMILAKKLEQNEKKVKFHATTRSPICVSNEKNYPLNTRFSLTSIYDDNRETYIYNLKKYDCVIIITDSNLISKGTKNLISALKSCDNENIYIIRCY